MLLITVSSGKLKLFETNLKTVKEFVQDTPITLTFKEGKDHKGIVFLAHGFAGSTSFMRPIAVALAEAGYLTVRFDFLGHGRHPLPYSGDITTIAGATQNFVNQTNEVISHYLTKHNTSFSMIIGHSMASDIVIRSASINSRLDSVVAISAYTDALQADKPKNVLILNGQWEPQLRAKSLEILKTIGINSPSEGTRYGNLNENTIREVDFIPNADHVGVLYSIRTQKKLVEWTNLFVQDNQVFKGNSIGIWTSILFFSIFSLVLALIKFIPLRMSGKHRLSYLRFFSINILACTISPLILHNYKLNFVEFPAHNHLINHLVLISIILFFSIPYTQIKALPKSFNLPLFTFLFILCCVLFGVILDSYVSSFLLTGIRVPLFFYCLLGSVPLMVLMQIYYDSYLNGWIVGNIFKLFLIISLSTSILLDISNLFIMGYAIILFIAFSLIFGFLANMISRKYNNTLSVGLANGTTLAWTFSTALPLYVN
jgi:pimeloyl-ACP methyl ester carboxylesterase